MRDQLITLSMRKPNRIKTQHDVQMLAVDDFDTEPLGTNLIRLLGDCPAMSDHAKRKTLAKICIEKVKLCICIHRILATQYSETVVNMARATRAPDVLVMLTPKQAMGQIKGVMKCEQQLDEWNENLPQDCYFRERRTSYPHTEDLETLSVHRAVLNMLYLTASSALHRPQVVSDTPSLQSIAFDLHHLSLRRAKEAATGITKIAESLQDHRLTRYLPPVGVTIMIPAVMISLLEIKADPTIGNASIHRFQQCIQVLQDLQEVWASADYAYSFLDAAVRKSHIEIVQGTKRKGVQDIADIMDLHDLMIPHTDPHRADAESARTGVKTTRWLRSDSAMHSTALRLMTETTSVAEVNCGFSDEFEALIDFSAFSESFGAGAGLGVDLNGV